MSAMLAHIRVTCFSKKYRQTESKVIILVSSQSKNMASEQKTIHSFIVSRHCSSNSDYAKRLVGKVKERYLKKILTIGINPALIEGKTLRTWLSSARWIDWFTLLLVLETSFYTKNQFKAFRSLEACNQVVSGFVYNAQGHHTDIMIIASKFVVLAKVRHSQRMNEVLSQIWIITEKDGTINCKIAPSHCHLRSKSLGMVVWQSRCEINSQIPLFAKLSPFQFPLSSLSQNLKKCLWSFLLVHHFCLSLGFNFLPEPLIIFCHNTFSSRGSF